MAKAAYVRTWDEAPDPASICPVRPALKAERGVLLAPDERAYYLWHHQQLERIEAAFGRPAKVSAHSLLPLSTRLAVIGGGALLGWAVPIALASMLVR